MKACGAFVLACVIIACSVGQGSGWVRGHVAFPDCSHLDDRSFDLRPDFFVAHLVRDPATTPDLRRQVLVIRIQRGSYGEWSSNGVSLTIRDADAIARSLGTPVQIGRGRDVPVAMSLYLGETCPSGVPNSAFFTVPAVLSAVGGTITFTSIYAPDIDPNATGLDAHFDNVHFEDQATPSTRFADLNGAFMFFYQRGPPAQHFP